jgi:metal-dependent amidase/aminoacylase/carboxypeptidase family protein
VQLVQRQFLWLVLLLVGCVASEPIPVSENLSPAQQKAQNVINEANLTMTSAANVVAQKKAAGVTTRAQAQRDLDKVKGHARDIDKAQALLDAGFTLDAETLAAAMNKALLALHKEISERKAKQ